MWEIKRTEEILEWIKPLSEDHKEAVFRHIIILSEIGPALGRPYADTVKGSKFKNMKELRVQSKKSIIRILYVFDPKRNAILLIGGDKKGDKTFYKRMIPIADKLYKEYLKTLRG